MISLILIPILAIFFCVFIGNLFTYALYGDINVVFTLVSVFGIISLSLILPNGLETLFKNVASLYNLNDKSNLFSSYISFILLLLYAISLILNSIFVETSVFKIGVGTILIILFSIVTKLLFTYEIDVFEVISFDSEETPKLYMVTMEDKFGSLYETYTNRSDIEENKYYKVKVNKKFKIIKSILNEVNNID